MKRRNVAAVLWFLKKGREKERDKEREKEKEKGKNILGIDL